MQENQTENTAAEVKHLVLDDKSYKLDDLTDECLQHLNNIRVVEEQIGQYQTTVQLLGISKNTLLGGLRASLSDIPFTKVEKEEEPEAPSED